jgi:phage-related protein
MKPLIWMGSTYSDLVDLPAEARRDAGYQLRKVQRGEDPTDWKPMATVGVGVREIRIHERPGEFRVIYLATRPEGIYVLHCFRKQTAKAEKRDIELAAMRFKAIGK